METHKSRSGTHLRHRMADQPNPSHLYTVEELQKLQAQIYQHQAGQNAANLPMTSAPHNVGLSFHADHGTQSYDHLSDAFNPTPLPETDAQDCQWQQMQRGGSDLEESALFLQQLFQSSDPNDLEHAIPSNSSQNMIAAQVAPVSRSNKRKFGDDKGNLSKNNVTDSGMMINSSFANSSASVMELPPLPSGLAMTPSLQMLLLQAEQQRKKEEKETRSPSVVKPQGTTAVMPPSVPPVVRASDAPAAGPSLNVPSTWMSPSVMASTLPVEPRTQPASDKKRAGKKRRPESAQDALARVLESHGYPTTRYKWDQVGYHSVPSALQLASFGTAVVKAVHTSDVTTLSDLLSCGLSPNPCNQFRDSILDLVCKRGNDTIFLCLLRHGCDTRVCDGLGRTPLHHCGWAPEIKEGIVESLLKADLKQIMIEDKRGMTPLEYVRPDAQADWIDWLEDAADRLFPVGGSFYFPREENTDGLLAGPSNALPVPLAAAVSSGQISPAEIREMSDEQRARYAS